MANFKIGDKVKVTKKVRYDDICIHCGVRWTPQMNIYDGKVFTITQNRYNGEIYTLDDIGWSFCSHWLSKSNKISNWKKEVLK